MRAEAAITGRRCSKVLLAAYRSGDASSSALSRGGIVALGTLLLKYAQMREIKNELTKSSILLKAEKEQRQASYERLRFARGDAEMGGLTEQEALEYALMLSRDGELSLQATVVKAQSQEMVQFLELARIRAVDDLFASGSRASWSVGDEEEDGQSCEDDVSSTRRSPAPMLLLSFVASTSSGAWNIIHNAESATLWPHGKTRWGKVSKLRTVAVSRSARQMSGSHEQPSGLLSPSS